MAKDEESQRECVCVHSPVVCRLGDGAVFCGLAFCGIIVVGGCIIVISCVCGLVSDWDRTLPARDVKRKDDIAINTHSSITLKVI